MKRTLIFLLLGPTLVACTTAFMFLRLSPEFVYVAASTNRSLGDIPQILAMMLFLFTFLVAALTGPIDGCFARILPILWRAPLIAIAGGIIAVGLLLVVFGDRIPDMPIRIVIGDALCMGLCSLLSNDYGNAHRKTTEQP
jgi:hypothetical protein